MQLRAASQPSYKSVMKSNRLNSFKVAVNVYDIPINVFCCEIIITDMNHSYPDLDRASPLYSRLLNGPCIMDSLSPKTKGTPSPRCTPSSQDRPSPRGTPSSRVTPSPSSRGTIAASQGLPHPNVPASRGLSFSRSPAPDPKRIVADVTTFASFGPGRGGGGGESHRALGLLATEYLYHIG